MKNVLSLKLFYIAILGAILVLTELCCTLGNRNDHKMVHKAAVKYMAPPARILCKNPIVTFKDSSFQANTIYIPAPVSVGSEKKTLRMKTAAVGKLLPPEINPAGFYVHMKNYTTLDGLALSSISCCFKDHMGNLWFATYGAGVSRFDGKSFTNFAAEDGLPDNYIHCICEDKDGNLWFGTDGGGISCYDGKRFTTYDISNGLDENIVFSLYPDQNGRIWIGTLNYIYYLDMNEAHGGKPAVRSFSSQHRLPLCFTTSITKDEKGDVWFGTNGSGLLRYNGRSIIQYTVKQGLLSDSIMSLAEDKAGRIWVGTSRGASCYVNKHFINYERIGRQPDKAVLNIYRDEVGNLWFGMSKNGVCFLSNKKLEATQSDFIEYNTAEGLTANTVFGSVEDNEGDMWFGYDGYGVDCYAGCQSENNNSSDGQDKPVFTTFTTSQGLPDNHVTAIFEDSKGFYWFGTPSGLCCYNGKSFVNYGVDQGLPSNLVTCIAEGPDGEIWFATEKGLASLRTGDSINAGVTLHSYKQSKALATYGVYYMYKDKNENMWICTYGGGIIKYDGKSLAEYTTDQGLTNNLVLGMTEDSKGNLWFCTYGGGVSKYDGVDFTNYTTKQGLANDKVNRVIQDKSGNLWFCTYGSGVSRFDGKTFTTFNTSSGLSDNMVTQIVEDTSGKLFFGTNKGISVLTEFRPIDMKNASNKRSSAPAANNLSNFQLESYHPVFEIYNEQQGYPVKDIVYGQNCLYMDKKGAIWASNGDTKMALVRFDYNKLHKNLRQPKVVMQSVKINNEKVCWYSLQPEISDKSRRKNPLQGIDSATIAQQEAMTFGKTLSDAERDTINKKFAGVVFDSITPFYPIPDGLVLPSKDNRITFSFAAIEPAKSSLVNYRYFLEGYDRSWSPLTNNTEATFSNISEGAYTFKVQAQSPDGIWCEPVLYSFTVLPPWYRTWWAYFTYTITTFLVLFLLYRWRTGKLRREKYQLEQKVRDRTAEVVSQKKLVEEKNKDILDSITYAKRLQDAILPPLWLVKQYFPDSFVFYKAKDIVAGDFYWLTPLPGGNGALIAACDCTGHGVPGAMVSVVCSNALNRAVKEFRITEPGKILDKTRELVLETFEKSEGNIQDGMDISLGAVIPSAEGVEFQWSGAYNLLWYIQNNECIEVPADKQPIGKVDNPLPFHTHHISLRRGDSAYLFTDGYADQFGGPKGKKYKYKQLKELLIANASRPMKEQNEILDQRLKEWRGNLDQVDDILIIGIRV